MSSNLSDSENNKETDHKSKTQLKKEMTELQELGQKLTRYTTKKLNKLSLPDLLRTAIDEYNRLPNSHGARKRQAQFIGRVMRDCDHQSIRLAIARLEQEGTTASAKQSYKQLCERLLTAVDEQVNELLSQYPNLERQKLRQLCRDCNKAKLEKQQVYKDKIIRYLREEIGDQLIE